MKKALGIIRGFGIWFKVILAELANNIISVLLVAAIYFMLWHFPQTLDLLLVLNQNDATSFWQMFTMEVPLYFALLTIVAFFIWNAPKYYYKDNYNHITIKNIIGFVPTLHYNGIRESGRYSYDIKFHVRKVLPRVLACQVLFISSFAILNAMEAFKIKNELTMIINPFTALAVVNTVLLLLLEVHVYRLIIRTIRRIPKKNYIVSTVLFLLLALILILGLVNNQAEEDLTLLFVSNLAVAIMFFIIAFNSFDLLANWFKPYFYGGIILSALAVFVVYGIFNFIPETTSKINPLSVLLICLTAIYTFSFILVFAGKKLRFPLFSFALIGALVLGKVNANRDGFTHYNLKEHATSYERPALRAYINKWLEARRDVILDADDEGYPVLFVSSEGGGSRAGLWAFLIHSYLEEQTNGAYFENHLFSLTGASGGGAGNAMFFATAQHGQNTDATIEYRTQEGEMHYKASEVYANNYLSSSIMGLLGRDLIQNVLGIFCFENRGELLQNEWQFAHNRVFNLKEDLLKKDILSFYESAHKKGLVPPLLMMNSSHTQTGKYSVISPVNIQGEDAFCGYYDFLEHLKTARKADKSIGLDAAMRINAAFPYITPLGEVKDMGLFGDAGYYDNIGGTVTENLMTVFEEVLETKPALKKKLKLNSMLIYSAIDNETSQELAVVTQLQAPIQTLMNVRGGHTKEMMARLDKVHFGLKRTFIVPTTKTKNDLHKHLRSLRQEQSDEIQPVLPLGRYLSQTAVYAMEKWMHEAPMKSKLDQLIPEIADNEVTKDTLLAEKVMK